MNHTTVEIERVEEHVYCPACHQPFAVPSLYIYRPLTNTWQALCRDCAIYILRCAGARLAQMRLDEAQFSS